MRNSRLERTPYLTNSLTVAHLRVFWAISDQLPTVKRLEHAVFIENGCGQRKRRRGFNQTAPPVPLLES